MKKLPPKGWWVFIFRPLLRIGLSFTLLFVGLFLLISQVLFPLFLGVATPATTLAPITDSLFGSASPLEGLPVLASSSYATPPTVLQEATVLSIEDASVGEVPAQFYLTVPALGIKQAVVETNSINPTPSQSLGHFRGSRFPGEMGTSFLYGHSALPWLFNSSNYKTIFSTLPDLTTSDNFYVHYKSFTYQYQIVGTKILAPNDVDPLKDYGIELNSPSTVVLMTCYPPGLSSKRYLVIGKLIF